MTNILAFDPGAATGIAEGFFSDTEALQLVDCLLVPYPMWTDAWLTLSEYKHDHVVSEKFVLSGGNEFVADLTPVKVEGTLDLLYGDELHYRTRDLKSQVSDDLLREIGWWKTGEDVEWEDGRDVNDAINHMLGYVAFDLQHLPTLKRYFR